MHYQIICLFFLFSNSVSAKSDAADDLYKIAVSIKECLLNKFPGVCLRERALEALNESTHTDEPIVLGFIRIEKNNAYNWNDTTDNALPTEISKRSLKLGDAIHDKFMEFLKSRSIRLNVKDAIEGRGKKGGGGGKGGGMMIKMAGAAACMGAGMMMGKMGMMAMGAMMMSKMALLLSAIMALKKMKGGGGDDDGGKEKQIKIVYATTSGGGGDYGKGGGGGGGWHRSLNHEPHSITYRSHVPQDANTNVVYEGTVECKKENDTPESQSNC